jgi:hypothetical protein
MHVLVAAQGVNRPTPRCSEGRPAVAGERRLGRYLAVSAAGNFWMVALTLLGLAGSTSSTGS